MASIDAGRTHVAAGSAAVHVGSFFNRVVAAVAAWNDRRITRKALSQLSDRELEDIGLSRADIETISERSF
jgi:uncharacterized protein YjiS (DUF1127 family)